MKKNMTSMERVLTTMSMKEPDRVPLFLLSTHFCAKLLDMSVEKYFSKPEQVVKGQSLMKSMFDNDCLNPFYSAAHEVSAFGTEIVYCEEGPPVTGEPIIKKPEDILKLQPPNILSCKTLLDALKVIEILKTTYGDTVPIGGGVLSPFSLPILQMGFDKYIELIYERPELLEHLYKVNEHFCIEWANLQLKAGATFITSIDSMAVSSIIPKEIYLKTGYLSALRTIPKINSAVALATSSASSATILEEVLETGIKAILVSHTDNLVDLKKVVRGRATLLGNLNGIEMCRLSKTEIRERVKTLINQGASGGGFILSDSLGDIPHQVDVEILLEVSDSVKEWGQY